MDTKSKSYNKNLEQILSVKNLATGYASQKNKLVVSQNLDLTIHSGELVSLLGPNGCGKSTLMRTIGGLQKAISGEITINGINLSDLSAKRKALLLSFVLTDKIDSANLKVYDIVAVGRYPYIGYMGTLSAEDKKIIAHSLVQCSLKSYESRLYSELSDGEKQRTMIARALAQDTPLMMLDEPTAHLDLPNRIEMMKMLRELAKNTNKAILLSTHELDLALQWSDTLWLMNREGNAFIGSPEDLVLNGSFSNVFGNDTFYFDVFTGNFKLHKTSDKFICLKGEGAVYEWTRRALEREGYLLADENCKTTLFSIEISNEPKWILITSNETVICSSITNLLSNIRSNRLQ